MVPANVENTVAAQKIQIRLAVHIVEIGPFGPCIDFVEANHSLRCYQRWVYMALVQLIVLTQPCRYDFLQIKSHCGMFCDVYGERNCYGLQS